ncbi:MAG: hypothetical protein ABIK37_04070, partial [candidate division WOR-3 bacterium]
MPDSTDAPRTGRMSVAALLSDKQAEWRLETLAGGSALETSELTTADINRPGLALAGYFGVFLRER